MQSTFNGFQNCSEISKAHIILFFHAFGINLSWKKSALVWSEILTLFVNTLTAHNKYSRCNVHNFMRNNVFKRQLRFQKWKTFCGFFIAFLKCACNLEHIEKEMSILA